MTDLHFPIGSVSHGTMLHEDQVFAFDRFADAFADAFAAYLERADGKEVAEAFNNEFNELSVEFYNTADEDKQSEIVDAMFDVFQAYAPDFTYFGANKGDGADYGFWPVLDFDCMDDEDKARFYISDHGNVTLYDRDKGDPDARIIWAVV